MPSVYSMFSVSFRLSTARIHACRLWSLCFSTSLAMIFPAPFSLTPPPSISPTHHRQLNLPLREACVPIRQTVNCARPTQTSKSYLPPHTGPLQSVRKMSVTSTYYLWKNMRINGLVWLRGHYVFTFDFFFDGVTFLTL